MLESEQRSRELGDGPLMSRVLAYGLATCFVFIGFMLGIVEGTILLPLALLLPILAPLEFFPPVRYILTPFLPAYHIFLDIGSDYANNDYGLHATKIENIMIHYRENGINNDDIEATLQKYQIPSQFTCPITQQVIDHPVFIQRNQKRNYEGSPLRTWVREIG